MKKRDEIVFPLTTILTFLILEAAAVFLMANSGVVQRFRVMGGVREAQAFFWGKNEQLRHYFCLRSENDRLIEENLALKNELDSYRTFVADADSLAALTAPEFKFVKAKVIKSFTDRQINYITIDRGSRHGVKPGMGVITDRGIIGIVNACGERYSQVISFLSKGQTVSAKIEKNGAFGPMNWTGNNPHIAIMHEVSVHAEAAPGDTVVSSGFSSIYPSDVPIGTIVSAEILNGSSQEVKVQLFEDYGSIHTVYVAANNRIDEINEVQEDVK